MQRQLALEDAAATGVVVEETPATTRFVDNEVKGCPRCGVPIMRTAGCPHMICGQRRQDGSTTAAGCQYQFCWDCGAAWSGHTAAACRARPRLAAIATMREGLTVPPTRALVARHVPFLDRATTLSSRAYRQQQHLLEGATAAAALLQHQLTAAGVVGAVADVQLAQRAVAAACGLMRHVYAHQLTLEQNFGTVWWEDVAPVPPAGAATADDATATSLRVALWEAETHETRPVRLLMQFHVVRVSAGQAIVHARSSHSLPPSALPLLRRARCRVPSTTRCRPCRTYLTCCTTW